MAPTMAQLMPFVTDEALAQAAQAGDTGAYRTLVERYQDMVYAYAYAHLRSREDAEDIAQEAFVKAYEALIRQTVVRSWASWLMCIVRNLCRDAARRRAVRVAAAEDLRALCAGQGTLPEDQLLAGERRRQMQAAVDALPDRLRIPLVLHYAQGLTYQQIAAVLGVRPSTVVGRIAGALRRLRGMADWEVQL